MKPNDGVYMADFVETLTPRKREVVELVGGEGLSYPEAAVRMGHYYRGGDHISPETVRRYASEIRDEMGVSLTPQRAMWHLYHRSGAWVRP